MGFGVEALGKRWDFRVNAYLPIERSLTSIDEIGLSKFVGNQMILAQNYQMKGFNTNFGIHFGRNRICDFYTCAGPYFFAGDLAPHIWGGKASFMIRFSKCVTIELSNSYDAMFKNRFQASVGFTIPLGRKSDEPLVDNYNLCGESDDLLLSRMTQPVQRQEIAVLGSETIAIDPLTGQPYNIIFVDNTSHSLGTYESPYPTFAQAQANSKPGDIIYVYPGNGTTMGMDSGITLQQNQKLWGSGTSHALPISQGTFIVPAQTTTMPKITNRNIDTDRNAVTLSSVNEVSGFNIVDVFNDAIIGTNVKKLSVDNCMFQSTTTYCIQTASTDQASINVLNNTFENNTNGSFFDFSGGSNLLISGNTVTGTTSPSSPPFSIVSSGTSLITTITNNTISDNRTGAFQFVLNDTNSAQLTMNNNIITNNGSGSLGTNLGSSLVINANNTTINNCQLNLIDNVVTDNASSFLYFSQGYFNDLQLLATDNTITGNGGSGFSFDTDMRTFTLTATDNIISGGGDNGIVTAGGRMINTATMTISNNQIMNNSNQANGIALIHSGTNFTMTLTGNDMSNNEGSGLLMYSSDLITNVTMNIENNIITNNQNRGINAAGGVDIEEYINLSCFLTNNTLTDNATAGLWVASTDPSVFVDLQMSGNNATDTGYTLVNNGGLFNLAPCNVEIVNTGTITEVGTITPVQSCPADEPCS